MEKSNFEVNIVKSSYSNVTESNEENKARNAQRNKWLIFHYMFNTNQPFTNIECKRFKELENKLVEGFKAIVGTKEKQNIYNYVTFKEQDGGTYKIKNFKCSGASEIGNEQHRLHFHVLLAFFHNSLIRINYEKIKRDMEKSVGLPLAVFYKVYSKADFNIQNYIMKYHDIAKTKKPNKPEALKEEKMMKN